MCVRAGGIAVPLDLNFLIFKSSFGRVGIAVPLIHWEVVQVAFCYLQGHLGAFLFRRDSLACCLSCCGERRRYVLVLCGGGASRCLVLIE